MLSLINLSNLRWASHTNTDVSARYRSCAQTPRCTLYHRLFHWQRHLPSLINIGREKSPDLLLSVESFINRVVSAAVIRHCNTSLEVNMADCISTPWISLFSAFWMKFFNNSLILHLGPMFWVTHGRFVFVMTHLTGPRLQSVYSNNGYYCD